MQPTATADTIHTLHDQLPTHSPEVVQMLLHNPDQVQTRRLGRYRPHDRISACLGEQDWQHGLKRTFDGLGIKILSLRHTLHGQKEKNSPHVRFKMYLLEKDLPPRTV